MISVCRFHRECWHFIIFSYEIISEILSCSKLGTLEFQFFFKQGFLTVSILIHAISNSEFVSL